MAAFSLAVRYGLGPSSMIRSMNSLTTWEYLSPSAAKLLVENYQHTAGERSKQDPYNQLTERERDILKLLAEGHSTQEVADLLVITTKTVEGHKTNLMAKLGVHNRIDLVKYAMRKGIITF